MRGAVRALAPLAFAWVAASCSDAAPTPAEAGTSMSATGTLATGGPVMAAPSSPAPSTEADGFARLPIEAATEARDALAKVPAEASAEGPAYLRFRRAVSRGELFFRERGFMSEALFGAGLIDETGGPLGKLDAALVAGDPKAVAEAAGDVDRALQLLADSLRRTPVRRELALSLLPRAAFALGATLAGSRPGAPDKQAAALADAQGLLDAVEQGAATSSLLASKSLESTAAANRLGERISTLRTALSAAGTDPLADRASLVVTTARLGVELRSLLGPSAWKPYVPRVRSASRIEDELLSVLTLPVLRRTTSGSRARETGQEARLDDPRLAVLGERLFSDKSLSPGGKRSCATCHVPDKGYADARPRAPSLDPKSPVLRHTPTLLYASYHAAQLWDGRALTSEKQALLVMHSRAEMGGTEGVFPHPDAATAQDAALALAAFQTQRLAPATSPMDRFARGEEGALSAEDRAGFDVFAGKGRCARCHVPPFFGGSHPTDFATPVYAALGVPATPTAKELDPDKGRGAVTMSALDRGAFKTPTLRDVAKTAPYFHNGAFPTLESVVDFYDKGGGRGLGLEVENQDPDVRPLQLTPAEKRALLRFLRVALTD